MKDLQGQNLPNMDENSGIEHITSRMKKSTDISVEPVKQINTKSMTVNSAIDLEDSELIANKSSFAKDEILSREAISVDASELDLTALERGNSQSIKFAKLITFLTDQGVRFNTFNHKPCMMNGMDLDDRLFNTLYINASKIIKGIAQSDLKAVIKSQYIDECNPVRDKFLEWSLLKSDTELDKFLRCLEFEAEDDGEFISKLIIKWLMQFPAMAIDDVYPRLVLALIGPSHIGKTTLLRKLFPEVLSEYYAESELNREKDSLILLSEKLFLNLDEFGGIAKLRPELFKFLVSSDKFNERLPYGHFNQKLIRRAVLSGTSNDKYIINDNHAKNSRIIPCLLSGINKDLFNTIDTTLLMAEVTNLYLDQGPDGIRLTVDEVERLAEFSEDFRIFSLDHDILGEYLGPGENFQTSKEIIDYLDEKLGNRFSTKSLKSVCIELNIKYKRDRIGKAQPRGYLVEYLK